MGDRVLYRTIYDEKIKNCEIAYYKCFAEAFESKNVIRFRDNLLTDMHYHNFTLIKRSDSDKELFHCIEDEIAWRRTEGEDFCNIIPNIPITANLLQRFKNTPQTTVSGYYAFDVRQFPEFRTKRDCLLTKVDHVKMLEDTLRLDIEEAGDNAVIDFCTRKVNRRGKVYLSNKGVDSYLCYEDNQVVGTCDLFIHENIAKIEDFSVSKAKQRQGYGTAILKSIMEIAINSGASMIYLLTHEEDTAKEMYLKCGFTKINEQTDLFFKL